MGYSFEVFNDIETIIDWGIKDFRIMRGNWYDRVDSNHRPPPCQGGALTS